MSDGFFCSVVLNFIHSQNDFQCILIHLVKRTNIKLVSYKSYLSNMNTLFENDNNEEVIKWFLFINKLTINNMENFKMAQIDQTTYVFHQFSMN